MRLLREMLPIPLKNLDFAQARVFLFLNLFILIEANYFTILWWFLPYIDMNQPCVPHPEHPSHLPPNPIPLVCPSAPALSALFHASNLDW